MRIPIFQPTAAAVRKALSPVPNKTDVVEVAFRPRPLVPLVPEVPDAPIGPVGPEGPVNPISPAIPNDQMAYSFGAPLQISTVISAVG
jgi:hypothetical protein